MTGYPHPGIAFLDALVTVIGPLMEVPAPIVLANVSLWINHRYHDQLGVPMRRGQV